MGSTRLRAINLLKTNLKATDDKICSVERFSDSNLVEIVRSHEWLWLIFIIGANFTVK